MKRILISIALGTAIFTIGLIGIFFFAGISARSTRHDILPSDWNLGKGSIRLGRSSSSSVSLALTPELATLPAPTNQWWSSALTGPWPDNLFNEPWSTKLSADGLSVGIPKVVATSDSIGAPFVGDLIITAPGDTLRSTKVDAHDDLSVDLRAISSKSQVAFSVLLVKGLPYQYVTYSQPLKLTTSTKQIPTISQLADGRRAAKMTINGRNYEAIASPASGIVAGSDGVVITPGSRDDTLVLMAQGNGAEATDSAYEDGAKALVTGGTASYTVEGQKVTTHLDWRTASGQTLHLVLPHQAAAGAGGAALGSFATVRGTAAVVRGNSLSYTQPVPENVDELSLPHDDKFFTKAKLETYLQQAVKTTAAPSGTSYNGGKELFGLANLLQMAKAASSPTAAAFQDQLSAALIDWLTYSPGESSRYFAYDAHIRGLVAVTPEFGSEMFNDHHFHYGYFLYAASLLGRYDPKFVKGYGKAVDLLAADIATTTPSDPNFPRLRSFDAYAGHSWADGFSRFADGNNQESSSEAVNAWYALMEWGKVSKNAQLQDTGKWLYANEAASALTYNFAATKTNLFPSGYKHHQVSLLWGGKSDWATWFSAAPEAKHAILMLPLSGGSLYLNSGSNLKDDFAALATETSGKPPSSFGDILLMTQALTDPAAAQAKFSDSLIPDNSNTLAYIYYWLAWAGQHPSIGAK